MVVMDGQGSATRLAAAVAEELRVLLVRKRLSGVQLAKLMGVSQPYLSRRLNGTVAFDLDDLERATRALDVDLLKLLQRAQESADSGVNFPFPPTTLSATGADERPMAVSPFGGGRKDSVRPTSAIPATKRRPARIRSSKRPGPR